MRRLLSLAVALLAIGGDGACAGPCGCPGDAPHQTRSSSVGAHAHRRTPLLRSDAGLVPGSVNYRAARARDQAHSTRRGSSTTSRASCELRQTASARRSIFTVQGATAARRRRCRRHGPACRATSVRDKVDLLVGTAARSLRRSRTPCSASIRSIRPRATTSRRVKPETTMVDGQVNLLFRVDEGTPTRGVRRRVDGNRRCLGQGPSSARWRRSPRVSSGSSKGELDNDKFAGDIGERIPGLYRVEGLSSTRRCSRTRSWSIARAERRWSTSQVSEGPRYQIGNVRGDRQPALLERGHAALLSVRRSADDADRRGEGRSSRGPRATTMRTTSISRRGTMRRAAWARRTRTKATSTRTCVRSSSAQGRHRLRADREPPVGSRREDSPRS